MGSPSIVEILARAAVPAVVLLVFALARRFMSAATLKRPARAYSMEDLELRFSSVQ